MNKIIFKEEFVAFDNGGGDVIKLYVLLII